jgi:hypothetical protein
MNEEEELKKIVCVCLVVLRIRKAHVNGGKLKGLKMENHII